MCFRRAASPVKIVESITPLSIRSEAVPLADTVLLGTWRKSESMIRKRTGEIVLDILIV
jgi:hypothetical protein